MARSVEDLALLYALIAGPDGRDTEVPPGPIEAVPERELASLRIAFAPTLPGFPVAAEIRDGVEALAQQLLRAGAVVEEAKLPALDFTQELASASELIMMMVGAFEREADERSITLAQYLEALHRRDQSILAWETFFQAWDVLLCPASMVTAFPHCETGAPLQVDGRDEVYWMVSAHATVFNYSGHPAVTLPYALDRAGLPLGVQLVGKRWDESRLLAIARVLAAVTGEFRRPSGY